MRGPLRGCTSFRSTGSEGPKYSFLSYAKEILVLVWYNIKDYKYAGTSSEDDS
jgi:hypothetical protein